jgi:hypothetical protein
MPAQIAVLDHNFLVIWYPTTQNSQATRKNFEENLPLLKNLLKKQSCDKQLFTHFGVVLSAATNSTAHYHPSCRCHYSDSDA